MVSEPAYRLVAEDRLEHLLADHGGAAGDADLGAGDAARWSANTTTISATESPLTP